MAVVIDAHQDIAYNAINFNRDYLKGALNTRRQEANSDAVRRNGIATLGLLDALLGRVGVVFSTLFVIPASLAQPWEKLAYRSPREAHQLALRQMDYYQRLADENEKIHLVKTQRDLDAVLATWDKGKEVHEHHQGLVVLMEGADPIIEPRQFEEWYERGVRIVGPAWSQTRYAGGTGAPGQLTALGRELLENLADLNAILDLSHLAEEAYFDALDHYEGSIIASHSNPRRFHDSDRHLSDEMIQRLAERDGVMGIMVYNRFLKKHWSPKDPPGTITLTTLVDVIDYVCQLTGSAAHVGIGSDLDGGFGAESIPDGLDTVGDLWNIGAALYKRGYLQEDIDAILGGNMLRKLRQGLPES